MDNLFGAITIDEFQRNKINELRQAIGNKLMEETSIFDDDFSLLRWLHFNDYKISRLFMALYGGPNQYILDEIVTKFKRSSSVLRALKLNNLEIDDIDEINKYINNLFPAAKHFPGLVTY